MLERDIEAYLVKRVKELGGEVRKVSWLGRNGAPDRFVMLPPQFVADRKLPVQPRTSFWVELKAPGQKAKPHQLREHARMEAMGERVVVVDSHEGVDEVLG